ncbi:hypothetical protein [Myroides odoratus]|uniref:Lipoprotein n=1 Tax=Myroides odoratus TaxID=256 RepID=A0A9Q6Z646_MYROD|nr:hypothetical protein [Myroides odoratus]EHQ41834.1 hypothetical protein Myrod_1000 [Myroides odoratus DSM 2801]EKB08936.1 hypothetical protein HMPREF9716_00443 [Myroides odoratus CIP 103059]QQT99231.1 hypothetical protein I6I88_13585 [Myroides odoratus]WQD58570.1 hypothetical protein U0010_05375 [Myroides odoratus]STZ29096.1 Uncharacterised protein [Myroides odoratus]
MKKLLFILCVTVGLVSCNQKVAPPQTVNVKDQFTMDMPATLAAMTDLYPNADIQYGNTYKQVYIIAKESPKTAEEDFKTFTQKALAAYSNRPDYEIVKEDEVRINGLPGKIYHISMSQEGNFMYMIQAMVEGKKGNYEIIGWTIGQNKDYQGEELMNIISTFKEL